MTLIMIFPFTVLVLSLTLLALTRSKKGFSIQIWKFWRDQKKNEMTDEKAKEIKHGNLIKMTEIRKREEMKDYIEQQELKTN